MNRFGLAIQIGFLRPAGRPLDPMRLIPPTVLACVAEQTGVAAPMIATLRAIYRRRRRTLFEYRQAATSQKMTAISGALTLPTNSVMAWNADQMQRIVTEGGPALYPDAHLARIAPVACKHINMNGVMRFRIEESHNLVRRRARRA